MAATVTTPTQIADRARATASDSAKAWTLTAAPDRVMVVPSVASTQASRTVPASATDPAPGRRTEDASSRWSAAVAPSHGSRAVFSIGSQAQ
jgi:hypothetical protein